MNPLVRGGAAAGHIHDVPLFRGVAAAGRMRRRRRKKKSNMTTKLARMTKVLSRSPSTRNISTTTKPSQNVAAGVTEPAVPGGGRRRYGKGSRR